MINSSASSHRPAAVTWPKTVLYPHGTSFVFVPHELSSDWQRHAGPRSELRHQGVRVSSSEHCTFDVFESRVSLGKATINLRRCTVCASITTLLWFKRVSRHQRLCSDLKTEIEWST